MGGASVQPAVPRAPIADREVRFCRNIILEEIGKRSDQSATLTKPVFWTKRINTMKGWEREPLIKRIFSSELVVRHTGRGGRRKFVNML